MDARGQRNANGWCGMASGFAPSAARLSSEERADWIGAGYRPAACPAPRSASHEASDYSPPPWLAPRAAAPWPRRTPRCEPPSPHRAPAPGDGTSAATAAAPPEHKRRPANRLPNAQNRPVQSVYICNMQDGSAGVVPPTAGQRPLLTTRAAARLAACHEANLRRAVRAGNLPAVRLGKRGNLRIPVDELERWLRPARSRSPP